VTASAASAQNPSGSFIERLYASSYELYFIINPPQKELYAYKAKAPDCSIEK
jgi:hypothetical protein